MMRLLLISSSRVHGYGLLDHAETEIRDFLGSAKRIAFVPFALFDRAGYTQRIRERLSEMGFDVNEVRSANDLDADAIFVGGGNTFRLLKTLYERKMLDPIRERVRGGTLYMGSSAGSVIAAPTMRTTNDMPIVEPPTLASLGLVPYQINGHYIDADPASTHMGETREIRLTEFLEENATPVIGIREGTMLRVEVLGPSSSVLGSASPRSLKTEDRGPRTEDMITTVRGTKPAKIFKRGEMPFDVQPGTKLDGTLSVVTKA